MRTGTTGSAFRGRSASRALVTAVLMTLFGCLAMGASHSRSAGRPSAHGAAVSQRSPAPGSASVRHRVVKGENLYRIAVSYGVTVSDLCRANGIKDSSQVTVGRVLFVPVTRSARRPASPSKGRGATAGTMKASLAGIDLPPRLVPPEIRTAAADADTEGHDPTETEEIPPGEASPNGISFSLIPTEEPFSWPVQGGIVRSSFGMRHGRQHAGIDICAPTGSPIYAARDGVVSYSGHKYRGYGNIVMLDHGDGFISVYAHNTVNLVQEGDAVVRGQIIARVGATGNATGSHCHFEIRNENVSVDPRGYLSENPDDDVIFVRSGPPRTGMPMKQAGNAQTSDLLP